ncbi:MAG: glutathione S-transferase family protein [Thermoleophilia bacterium]|nr:glutathione S-transferase family protein [Thermoleophilia bacterium]
MSRPAQFPDETDGSGRFVRQPSAYRGTITQDHGTDLAIGRYHLYVSLACPWAHRVIIAREIKGLTGVVGMTVVDPIRDDQGWAFTRDPDPVNGFHYLREAYAATDPDWTGRVSVPVLWDRRTGRIVNNESEDILRILESGFASHAAGRPILRPVELVDEIDRMNELLYHHINDCVYRAGFAGSQTAYDSAAADLEEGLSHVESVLEHTRWLVGNRFTEADIRLFTTLVRFDPVYHTHFRCNRRLIADSPPLLGFLRDVAQIPGVMNTISLDDIKRHYYLTHRLLNPGGIIPTSNGPNLIAPHGRDHLGPDALAP